MESGKRFCLFRPTVGRDWTKQKKKHMIIKKKRTELRNLKNIFWGRVSGHCDVVYVNHEIPLTLLLRHS